MIYIYPNTVKAIKKFIKEHWPSKSVRCQDNPNAWHKYRYIQVSTCLENDLSIHYELTNGYVELHLEGDDYDFYRYLRNSIPVENKTFLWHRWNNMTQGRLRLERSIDNMVDLQHAFTEMIDLIDPVILKYQNATSTPQIQTQSSPDVTTSNDPVSLSKLNLKEVYALNVSIPEYQRIYCWPEKNVLLLLDDILQPRSHQYHVGTLILQNKVTHFDIIDGQQRLVTFALILHELGIDNISILNERFHSTEAIKYVAYNKFLIRNYINRFGWNEAQKLKWAEKILIEICFDVLSISDSSLDLAYTFFSSQNSRGKALTDYELLKSHHLRYIPMDREDQQRHLAGRWDDLLKLSERDTGDRSVSIVMGIYLYCMRKWTRRKTWYIKERNRVKNEFEAAAIIPEIPPFGEKFEFYDPIQGGTHFFAYVENFVQKYNIFKRTEQFAILWNTISCSGLLPDPDTGRLTQGRKSTHWWFGDVIATFLFAYYLKFGSAYLAEALTCITRIVSQSRYITSKANKQTLLERAGETDLIMMINQATSPTFFLAEAKNTIKKIPALSPEQREYIRGTYLGLEKSLYKKNSRYYSIEDFNNLHIQ